MKSVASGSLLGIIATALALSAPASAKERTVKWESEFCTHSAKYDPEVYDAKTVSGTHQFVDVGEGVTWPSAPIVFEPEALSKVDIPQYQAQCERTLNEIRGLSLVDLPSVEEYRKAKLEEVRDTCAFEVVQMRAYRNASALRSYQPSEVMCSRYIDALEGKAKLTEVWRATIDERCKNNGSPKACRDRHLADGEKPDGTDRIKLYVQNFGWTNCSTNFTKANTIDFDGLRRRFMAEFKQRFKLREQCDAG